MNSMIKKIGIGISIVTLLMGSTAMAAEKTLNEVKFTIGQPKYSVGDTVKDIDAAPYIKDGRTMLPIRYVAEVVGIDSKDILWDGGTKTVTIFKGTNIIQMTVGNSVLAKDGQKVQMDVAPEIINGRTMLPVSFIAKALDIDVAWSSLHKTVTFSVEGEKEEEKEIEVTWDYTYEELVEKALKNSRDLKKSEMLVERAEEIKDEARYQREIAKGEAATNLTLKSFKSAEFSLQQAKKDVETMKESIAYNARNAYYGVLKSNRDKELAKLGLEIKNETMNHTNLKYEQQMVSELEKNTARRDYEETKKQYEMSVKVLDSAYEKLNYLVGLNPDERYVLEDKVEFDKIPEIHLDLNTHIPTVINKSPQIWAMEQRVYLTELNVTLFVFNRDGVYEAAAIDAKTVKIDLANTKQAYEENLRNLHTALEVYQKQYETTMIAYEKSKDDLKVAKLNVEIGNAIKLQEKGAAFKVAELENKLENTIMDYNDKATLYEKPWLASK